MDGVGKGAGGGDLARPCGTPAAMHGTACRSGSVALAPIPWLPHPPTCSPAQDDKAAASGLSKELQDAAEGAVPVQVAVEHQGSESAAFRAVRRAAPAAGASREESSKPLVVLHFVRRHGAVACEDRNGCVVIGALRHGVVCRWRLDEVVQVALAVVTGLGSRFLRSRAPNASLSACLAPRRCSPPCPPAAMALTLRHK